MALQLGHRVSYDFDIFCAKEIPAMFAAKVQKEIVVRQVLVNNSDEFTFLTDHDIKVSFIFYPFDLKKYVFEFPDVPMELISPLGIAITKAYALNRRNAWRDYVDLYVILKKEITTLENIVNAARIAYGELFNEKLFLSQLLYTQDISKAEIENTQMLESATLFEVVSFFEKEVKAYWERKL